MTLAVLAVAAVLAGLGALIYFYRDQTAAAIGTIYAVLTKWFPKK